MSNKRGLSMDEKKQRILQIFYETKQFYQLKELEKIAPRDKGVVVQSVKEAVQSLVDDGLVDSDKIGTSIYYWAFPNKAATIRKKKLDELTVKAEEIKQKRGTLSEKLEKVKKEKTESSDCEEILKQLAEVKKKKEKLIKEMAQHKECDPIAFEDIKKQTEVCKEAANRWTDNIFSMKSWCRDKFNVDEEVLCKQFDIPEDLDFIS